MIYTPTAYDMYTFYTSYIIIGITLLFFIDSVSILTAQCDQCDCLCGSGVALRCVIIACIFSMKPWWNISTARSWRPSLESSSWAAPRRASARWRNFWTATRRRRSALMDTLSSWPSAARPVPKVLTATPQTKHSHTHTHKLTGDRWLSEMWKWYNIYNSYCEWFQHSSG